MSFCTPVWAQDTPDLPVRLRKPNSLLVRYDRGALIAGHDHVIQTQHSSTIIWNPNKPMLGQPFHMQTLDVDPKGPVYAGLKGQTSEGDKPKIKANMLGSNNCTPNNFQKYATPQRPATKGERVHVTGDLTLRSVTKTVTSLLDITVTTAPSHAKGEFRATHMKPFTALAGALRNDNPLRFFLESNSGS